MMVADTKNEVRPDLKIIGGEKSGEVEEIVYASFHEPFFVIGACNSFMIEVMNDPDGCTIYRTRVVDGYCFAVVKKGIWWDSHAKKFTKVNSYEKCRVGPYPADCPFVPRPPLT